MKVLPLAVSILAATLATASTALFLKARRDKLESLSELASTRLALASEEKAQLLAKEAIAEANRRLLALDKELLDTRRELTQTQNLANDLKQELNKSRNTLNLRDENERLLNREIASLNRDIADTRQKVTEMEALRRRIGELENQLVLGSQKVGADGLPLAATDSRSHAILALGPKDSFLIVDFGARHGAAKGRKLHVRQGTALVGTALINDVFPDVCIAQVDPQSLRAALRIGDGILLNQ